MASHSRKTFSTYISLEQAAEITDQSVKTIRRRVSDGSLPAYKFGPRHIRIRLEDLEAMARRIPSARS
ncbi:MAG TPA: helix-turn-helix domain-containing protein [Nocardioidaceae bacterium]|nr:helix-turn-helix domain-containing protein [Nocardioidaceae bacterium]